MPVSYLPERDSNGVQVVRVQSDSFSKKELNDGSKLFRRKHGLRQNAVKNTSTTFNFIVPYSIAKINEIEIVDGHKGDYVDFKVYDTPSGTISGTPNLLLNQFGFSAQLPDGFYRDQSNYDADVIGGMKIEVTYYNTDLVNDVSVGMNITYHQVVAP